jgi:hypothetical protein
MNALSIVIIVSEVVAAVLIFRLWRTSDLLFIKISLSLLAVIPLLGPILVLWIANFPNAAPAPLRDEVAPGFRRRGFYFSRWGPIVDERNPIRRFRLWRSELLRDRSLTGREDR